MLNHGFSLILLGNYSVGAFFTFFIKVSKHLRKCVPKWLPKGSKIELGAPWGSIFEVLGAFWTMSNFDEFLVTQKVQITLVFFRGEIETFCSINLLPYRAFAGWDHLSKSQTE